MINSFTWNCRSLWYDQLYNSASIHIFDQGHFDLKLSQQHWRSILVSSMLNCWHLYPSTHMEIPESSKKQQIPAAKVWSTLRKIWLRWSHLAFWNICRAYKKVNIKRKVKKPTKRMHFLFPKSYFFPLLFYFLFVSWGALCASISFISYYANTLELPDLIMPQWQCARLTGAFCSHDSCPQFSIAHLFT